MKRRVRSDCQHQYGAGAAIRDRLSAAGPTHRRVGPARKRM